MSHAKPCERCSGMGTIARNRRYLRNADGSQGDPDPSDIIGLHPELCPRCGGSGVVPLDLKTVEEKMPGYAADMLG